MKIIPIGEIPDGYVSSHYCRDISQLPGVEALVLLPDVHIKQKYLEAKYQCVVPSSSVTSSSRDYLYPQLRSRGIGCGMALWPLGLSTADIERTGLLGFFKSLFIHLTDQPSPCARLDSYIGKVLPSLPNIVRQASLAIPRRRCGEALRGGAKYYLDTFMKSSTPEAASAFEEQGNNLKDGQVLPREGHYMLDALCRGRDFSGGDHLSGLWISGNHFIELQEVSEIYDFVAIKKAGLMSGSYLLMSHSCGSGLEWILPKEIVQRRITLPEFRYIAPDEEDYRIIQFAVALLKNLGALRRAVFYKRCVDTARNMLPQARIRLLSECNHNDIDWQGENIYYRHNAIKLKDKQFRILSGSFNHPSYLIQPGTAMADACFSVGHGVGAFLEQVGFRPDHDRIVERMGVEMPRGIGGRYWKKGRFRQQQIPYYANDPGDALVQSLEDANIISLVAKLNPIFSANNSW